MKSDINFTYLFGSPIWNYDIVSIDRNVLKNYILDLKNKDIKGRVLSNSGGGWQSHNIPFNTPEFKPFYFTITNVMNSCYKELNGKADKYKVVIQDCWANVNKKGSFNWSHVHDGFLSMVYYVEADEDTGDIQFLHPSKLQSLNWDFNMFNHENITSTDAGWKFSPVTNRCLIFPSWLEHKVNVNNTNKTRISISLNTKLEKIL
tara:strand:- start:266 stop:877 length:612 start_codon:yes stop_codon:yes gene_type:complete